MLSQMLLSIKRRLLALVKRRRKNDHSHRDCGGIAHQGSVGRGDFKNLPGAGRPLELEDDSSIPEDLRMVYKLLKNGGYIDNTCLEADSPMPTTLSTMLQTSPSEQTTLRRMLKLQVIEARIRRCEGRTLNLASSNTYHNKVVERLSLSSQNK